MVVATASAAKVEPEKVKVRVQDTSAKAPLAGVIYITAVLLFVLLCLGWTVWLMILSAAPTTTVNWLMDTRDLDFGSFWRLSEPSRGVLVAGLVGLACVVVGYVAVLWQIAAHAVSYSKIRPKSTTTEAKPSAWRDQYVTKITSFLTAIQPVDTKLEERSRKTLLSTDSFKRTASRLASDMLDRESTTRRNLHSMLKGADIAIQCLSLAQLMEMGMPVALIGIFAATVALDALSAGVMFLLPHDNVGHVQLIVDTAFDFVVAVAFPVLVLTYALASFTFDKALMAINAQVFPPGFFERVASVVADPVEVANVRRTLDSLRIDSLLKIFTRVGANAALCRRCLGLVELLRSRRASVPNVYPKRKPLRAMVCLVTALLVVVVTTGSVLISSAACQMHPECVQIARRWIFDRAQHDPTRCPCLAMIDRAVAIATFDEWEKPIDRTQKLAQLASSGDLQTLQLVNRALPTLPEELRRCANLKYVSLYYTETASVPDWFAELSHLEFLHIEGKSPPKSLQKLPDGLFDNMHELAYLHLGMQALPRLPSFNALTNLQTLTLALLFFLTELPSLASLRQLERLTTSAVPRVDVFPDLTNVPHLESLVAFDRGAFCCNGFLGADKCNLTRSLCQPHLSGAPAITQCVPTDQTATPATRKYFDMFAASACAGEALSKGTVKFSPTRDEMAQCNGTLYRACQPAGRPPGTPAMCYNSRWMPVACDATPFPMLMRRQQIAQRHGVPCDPQIEAWLGCKTPG